MSDIEMVLSKSSIDEAIRALKKRKADLERQNELFIRRLTDIGIDVVHTTLMDVDSDVESWWYTIEVINDSAKNNHGATLRLSGKRILYIEFGSGVLKSQPQNPKAKEMGYGVGTNSPLGWAWNTTKYGGGWWYYDEDKHKPIHTYGIRAYAPLYKASVEMLLKVEEIAREVYGR